MCKTVLVHFLIDQPQPTLTLHVGVTYTFVVKNSDQKLFPFVFGTAVNTPYLSNSAIKVAVGNQKQVNLSVQEINI